MCLHKAEGCSLLYEPGCPAAILAAPLVCVLACSCEELCQLLADRMVLCQGLCCFHAAF